MIYSAHPKPHTLLEKQPLFGNSLSDSSLSGSALSDQELLLRIHQPSRFDATSPLQDGETSAPESDVDQFDLELATHIISRIESRLPGRIRHLTVFTTENAVVLTGECCTFYTKQVAQHAAMGVLEYEQLINNIDVRTVK